MKRFFAFFAWLVGVLTLGYIAFQGFSLVPKMEVYLAAGLAFVLTVSDGIFSFNLRSSKGWGRVGWTSLMLVAAGAACAGHFVNFTQKFQRSAHAPKIVAEAKLATERSTMETRRREMEDAKVEWENARNDFKAELTSGKGSRYEELVKLASEMQNIWRETEKAYREKEAVVSAMEVDLATEASGASILADLDWRIILAGSVILQIICGGLAWAASAPPEAKPKPPEEKKQLTIEELKRQLDDRLADAAADRRKLRDAEEAEGVQQKEPPKKRMSRKRKSS